VTFDAQEAVRQGTQAQGASGEIQDVRHITCVIAGCGPAGAMLGLLLARRGVDVLVLLVLGRQLRE
jgi:ribulose 1,5-bisphosphate synthetase/thiazole synthase